MLKDGSFLLNKSCDLFSKIGSESIDMIHKMNLNISRTGRLFQFEFVF
jgi:hypothetical protein